MFEVVPHPALSRIVAVLAFSFMLGALCSAASAQSADAPQWVEGEYIVKYDAGRVQQLKRIIPGLEQYSDQEVTEALTETMAATTTESLPLIDAHAIKASSGQDIDIDAAVDLLDAKLADYISPNFIRTINRTPNDPSYSSLWGMNQANDNDINAPEAWDTFGDDMAKDIVVGVVDTGVDYTHPDLAANMWVNDAEKNGLPGVDDDGNGVVDDVYGYNAIANSGNPLDDNNHGSHCSGTIGGVGNNGAGVAGVAWKVKIMALKFLSASGSGSDVDAIKAINYGVSMRNRGGKLRVLSNSWGGSGYNPAMLAAIQAANSAGILFVAAAGNNSSNNDTTPNYPSNYSSPNMVVVAAIQQDGTKASFSNYGATTVSFAAPGVGIYSTVKGGGYASFNGTSMATPHVSGVAALMYAKIPQYAPQDAKAQLMATVKPRSALNGLMAAPGIVDARAAVADPANFPPDLATIPPQFVTPNTRVKTIALIANDREHDTLSFSAQVVLPTAQAGAAAADTQYNFTAYQPEYDNYYRLSEKRIVSGDGKTYLLFADGTLYELIYPYLYYRTVVDPSYYQTPSLLVTASTFTSGSIATVRVEPNTTPPELRVEVAPAFSGSFNVITSVSDGNRSDAETFSVTVQKPGSCT